MVMVHTESCYVVKRFITLCRKYYMVYRDIMLCGEWLWGEENYYCVESYYCVKSYILKST